MVFIDKHSQEIYWLKRRIDFLKRLDAILNDEDRSTHGIHIDTQYETVDQPFKVVDRLKDIYGDELQ